MGLGNTRKFSYSYFSFYILLQLVAVTLNPMLPAGSTPEATETTETTETTEETAAEPEAPVETAPDPLDIIKVSLVYYRYTYRSSCPLAAFYVTVPVLMKPFMLQM